MTLLVAGGPRDPNVQAVLSCARQRGQDVAALLVGDDDDCRLHWNLQRDELRLDDKTIRPSGCFIRYDVFEAFQDGRPEVFQRAFAWYTVLQGWLLAHPDTRVLNRHALLHLANKPYVLHEAGRLGLPIPQTFLENELQPLQALAAEGYVAKPVAGGGYCVTLEEALAQAPSRRGKLASPAIVQERLVAPEVRIYVVGTQVFPFRVDSPHLDYRVSQNCEVTPLAASQLPAGTVHGLKALMRGLGMDFGAADFKTTREGRLAFMEINNAPMFSVFDRKVEGRLVDAILDLLVPEGSTRPRPGLRSVS